MEMFAITWMQDHVNFFGMKERLHGISHNLVIFSTYFLQNSNHKGIDFDSVAQPLTCK